MSAYRRLAGTMAVMDRRRWSEDYVAHVLRPNFAQAKRYLFRPLMLVNKAHAVTLWRAGLLDNHDVALVLQGLRDIEARGAASYSYSEDVEDLYFAVERDLIAAAGVDAGGNLQIARSRNDVDQAMLRMVLRETLLGTLETLNDLRQVIARRAVQHATSLMPGYTHTQPAQPTTLGHYLGAILSALARDATRLRAAYLDANHSPLGAAALTTSGFPIQRQVPEQLLGFRGLVENSIDAVGASDHVLQSLGAVLVLEGNLSRFNFDLLQYASREVGFLRVPDSFVQISSIMPQKRNPVVLEHSRARFARAHGQAQEVFTLARNVPYGDTNDVGENLIEPTFSAFTELGEGIALLSAVLEDATFNVARMQALAGDGFTTATGLADWLVQHRRLPFRTAHGIASRVVDLAVAAGLEAAQVTPEMVDVAALERVGHPVELTPENLHAALDPRGFVEARALPGGPASRVLLPFLARAQDTVTTDEAWRRAESRRLRMAREALDTIVDDLIPPSRASGVLTANEVTAVKT